jgi:hypothetical protein
VNEEKGIDMECEFQPILGNILEEDKNKTLLTVHTHMQNFQVRPTPFPRRVHRVWGAIEGSAASN